MTAQFPYDDEDQPLPIEIHTKQSHSMSWICTQPNCNGTGHYWERVA